MRDYLFYFGQTVAAVDTNAKTLTLVGDYVFSGINDIHFKSQIVNIGTLVTQQTLKSYTFHAVSAKSDKRTSSLKEESYKKELSAQFDESVLITDAFTERWIRNNVARGDRTAGDVDRDGQTAGDVARDGQTAGEFARDGQTAGDLAHASYQTAAGYGGQGQEPGDELVDPLIERIKNDIIFMEQHGRDSYLTDNELVDAITSTLDRVSGNAKRKLQDAFSDWTKKMIDVKSN